MERARLVGNNIRLLINKMQLTAEQFANDLGYSPAEAHKLFEGRLFVDSKDLQDIAAYLHVDAEELTAAQKAEEYVGNGFVHYMGRFKNPDNEDKILDIFDMFCDIKESVLM